MIGFNPNKVHVVKANIESKKEPKGFDEVVRAFGDSLTIYDTKNSMVQKTIEQLGFLPDNLLKSMRKNGLKIVVGTTSANDLAFKSKEFQIKANSLYYKLVEKVIDCQASGRYIPAIKTIFVNALQNNEIDSGVILHEYGHAVADFEELSPLFKKIHERIYTKLDPYIQRQRPGDPVGVHELMADSFADFLRLNKERFISKYNKDAYDLWELFSVSS